jgi:probable rRNA maturation factor
MPRPRAQKASSGTAISIAASTGQEHTAYLRRQLNRALRLLRSPLNELSLALVGDRRMSRLHERHLGIEGPTDVLSFELEHDGRGRVLSGEVVLCVPEARRQARRRKTAERDEILLYTLHGVLHLSGYDDRTRSDYRKMHQMEDQILTQLGVGSVFDPRQNSPAGAGLEPGAIAE